MRIVKGDLFDSPDEAIGHGVNTWGAMGSGIAKPFRDRFPHMHLEYKADCESQDLKPGTAQVVHDVDQYTHEYRWIANIASQDLPGPNARYDWLATGLRHALSQLSHAGVSRLSLPKIGCGIGGLDWQAVKVIIDLVSRDFNITITVYSLDEED